MEELCEGKKILTYTRNHQIMKTFIVPTDFSETSKNAAIFAAQVASTVQDSRIILYHEFDNYVSGSDSSPLSDEPEARKTIANLALQNVKAAMQQAAGSVQITCIAEEESSFIKSVEKFVQDKMADLVLMGITDTTGIEQTLFGSNTLKLVNKNICPVMIIPPDARFKGIKNVAFATDYKDIKSSSPTKNIHAVLDLFKPTVHVVNVNEEDVQVSAGYLEERNALESILEGYHPTFHFIRQATFAEAISGFVSDKQIDLIITVPRKHSFFSNLFQASHTKQLAYHSEVPIIAIHE